MMYSNEIRNILKSVVTQQKLPHAILFEVDDYDDGMNFIKDFVKLILCNNKEKSFDSLNCGSCNICGLIDANNYPDFVVIETEGAWIKKQQLMDLQSDFNNRSLLNNKRIYVIKEAEKLNTSSSNSLLKFLEEPGDDIIAILLTKNRYLLLDTIISRCQTFNLKSDMYELDKFKSEAVDNFIEYIAKKQNLFIYYKDILENILVDRNTAKEVLGGVEKYFLYYLTNYNEIKDSDNFVFKMLERFTIDDMVNYVRVIEEEIQKLDFNVNFKIWLDAFFARIIGEVYV